MAKWKNWCSYIYVYLYEVCVLIFPLYGARYVGVESDICCVRGKTDYTLIPTSLFRECSLIREKILISEQLRNRLVEMKVQSFCFFPPIATYMYIYIHIYIYIYIYIYLHTYLYTYHHAIIQTHSLPLIN